MAQRQMCVSGGKITTMVRSREHLPPRGIDIIIVFGGRVHEWRQRRISVAAASSWLRASYRLYRGSGLPAARVTCAATSGSVTWHDDNQIAGGGAWPSGVDNVCVRDRPRSQRHPTMAKADAVFGGVTTKR